MNDVTTDAARVSAITWQIAVEPSSTHCHHARPGQGRGLAADASGGLVGTYHRTGAHRIGDGFCGGQQGYLGAGQDIGDRALVWSRDTVKE